MNYLFRFGGRVREIFLLAQHMVCLIVLKFTLYAGPFPVHAGKRRKTPPKLLQDVVGGLIKPSRFN